MRVIDGDAAASAEGLPRWVERAELQRVEARAKSSAQGGEFRTDVNARHMSGAIDLCSNRE